MARQSQLFWTDVVVAIQVLHSLLVTLLWSAAALEAPVSNTAVGGARPSARSSRPGSARVQEPCATKLALQKRDQITRRHRSHQRSAVACPLRAEAQPVFRLGGYVQGLGGHVRDRIVRYLARRKVSAEWREAEASLD
jgi:hypothetical protein